MSRPAARAAAERALVEHGMARGIVAAVQAGLGSTCVPGALARTQGIGAQMEAGRVAILVAMAKDRDPMQVYLV